MAGTVQILGVKEVMLNLNKELSKIVGKSMRGLIRSAIIIRRDMDKTPPRVPVMDGNLRASWFVVTATGPEAQAVTTAFGGGKFEGPDASDLAADHEMVQGKVQSEIRGRPIVGIGFSANYAAFVHEMKGAKFKRSGAGAGFFSSAVDRNKGVIVKTIQAEARL